MPSHNVEELFHQFMQDPDYIGKEELALAEAKQRVIQSMNNHKALSMAKMDSPVESLLEFLLLQKGDNDYIQASKHSDKDAEGISPYTHIVSHEVREPSHEEILQHFKDEIISMASDAVQESEDPWESILNDPTAAFAESGNLSSEHNFLTESSFGVGGIERDVDPDNPDALRRTIPKGHDAIEELVRRATPSEDGGDPSATQNLVQEFKSAVESFNQTQRGERANLKQGLGPDGNVVRNVPSTDSPSDPEGKTIHELLRSAPNLFAPKTHEGTQEKFVSSNPNISAGETQYDSGKWNAAFAEVMDSGADWNSPLHRNWGGRQLKQGIKPGATQLTQEEHHIANEQGKVIDLVQTLTGKTHTSPKDALARLHHIRDNPEQFMRDNPETGRPVMRTTHEGTAKHYLPDNADDLDSTDRDTYEERRGGHLGDIVSLIGDMENQRAGFTHPPEMEDGTGQGWKHEQPLSPLQQFQIHNAQHPTLSSEKTKLPLSEPSVDRYAPLPDPEIPYRDANEKLPVLPAQFEGSGNLKDGSGRTTGVSPAGEDLMNKVQQQYNRAEHGTPEALTALFNKIIGENGFSFPSIPAEVNEREGNFPKGEYPTREISGEESQARRFYDKSEEATIRAHHQEEMSQGQYNRIELRDEREAGDVQTPTPEEIIAKLTANPPQISDEEAKSVFSRMSQQELDDYYTTALAYSNKAADADSATDNLSGMSEESNTMRMDSEGKGFDAGPGAEAKEEEANKAQEFNSELVGLNPNWKEGDNRNARFTFITPEEVDKASKAGSVGGLQIPPTPLPEPGSGTDDSVTLASPQEGFGGTGSAALGEEGGTISSPTRAGHVGEGGSFVLLNKDTVEDYKTYKDFTEELIKYGVPLESITNEDSQGQLVWSKESMLEGMRQHGMLHHGEDDAPRRFSTTGNVYNQGVAPIFPESGPKATGRRFEALKADMSEEQQQGETLQRNNLIKAWTEIHAGTSRRKGRTEETPNRARKAGSKESFRQPVNSKPTQGDRDPSQRFTRPEYLSDKVSAYPTSSLDADGTTQVNVDENGNVIEQSANAPTFKRTGGSGQFSDGRYLNHLIREAVDKEPKRGIPGDEAQLRADRENAMREAFNQHFAGRENLDYGDIAHYFGDVLGVAVPHPKELPMGKYLSTDKDSTREDFVTQQEEDKFHNSGVHNPTRYDADRPDVPMEQRPQQNVGLSDKPVEAIKDFLERNQESGTSPTAAEVQEVIEPIQDATEEDSNVSPSVQALLTHAEDIAQNTSADEPISADALTNLEARVNEIEPADLIRGGREAVVEPTTEDDSGFGPYGEGRIPQGQPASEPMRSNRDFSTRIPSTDNPAFNRQPNDSTDREEWARRVQRATDIKGSPLTQAERNFVHPANPDYDEATYPTITPPAAEEAPAAEQPQFVNHSGGAQGADSVWGQIGEEHGVESRHYYEEGNKTPQGNTPISQEESDEAIPHLQEAAKSMGRPLNLNANYAHLLKRNWQQVKGGDAVFAVATIGKGGRGFQGKPNVVDGGTGWAVHMAINNDKPVHVFDEQDGKWHTWQDGQFVEEDTPTLTPNFAGIGSRGIGQTGEQAIRDVYQNTLTTTGRENLGGGEVDFTADGSDEVVEGDDQLPEDTFEASPIEEADGNHEAATGQGWGGSDVEEHHFEGENAEGEQKGSQGYPHEVQEYARQAEKTTGLNLVVPGDNAGQPHNDVYNHFGYEGGHMGGNPIDLQHIKDYIESQGKTAPKADWEKDEEEVQPEETTGGTTPPTPSTAEAEKNEFDKHIADIDAYQDRLRTDGKDITDEEIKAYHDSLDYVKNAMGDSAIKNTHREAAGERVQEGHETMQNWHGDDDPRKRAFVRPEESDEEPEDGDSDEEDISEQETKQAEQEFDRNVRIIHASHKTIDSGKNLTEKEMEDYHAAIDHMHGAKENFKDSWRGSTAENLLKTYTENYAGKPEQDEDTTTEDTTSEDTSTDEETSTDEDDGEEESSTSAHPAAVEVPQDIDEAKGSYQKRVEGVQEMLGAKPDDPRWFDGTFGREMDDVMPHKGNIPERLDTYESGPKRGQPRLGERGKPRMKYGEGKAEIPFQGVGADFRDKEGKPYTAGGGKFSYSPGYDSDKGQRSMTVEASKANAMSRGDHRNAILREAINKLSAHSQTLHDDEEGSANLVDPETGELIVPHSAEARHELTRLRSLYRADNMETDSDDLYSPTLPSRGEDGEYTSEIEGAEEDPEIQSPASDSPTDYTPTRYQANQIKIIQGMIDSKQSTLNETNIKFLEARDKLQDIADKLNAKENNGEEVSQSEAREHGLAMREADKLNSRRRSLADEINKHTEEIDNHNKPPTTTTSTTTSEEEGDAEQPLQTPAAKEAAAEAIKNLTSEHFSDEDHPGNPKNWPPVGNPPGGHEKLLRALEHAVKVNNLPQNRIQEVLGSEEGRKRILTDYTKHQQKDFYGKLTQAGIVDQKPESLTNVLSQRSKDSPNAAITSREATEQLRNVLVQGQQLADAAGVKPSEMEDWVANGQYKDHYKELQALVDDARKHGADESRVQLELDKYGSKIGSPEHLAEATAYHDSEDAQTEEFASLFKHSSEHEEGEEYHPLHPVNAWADPHYHPNAMITADKPGQVSRKKYDVDTGKVETDTTSIDQNMGIPSRHNKPTEATITTQTPPHILGLTPEQKSMYTDYNQYKKDGADTTRGDGLRSKEALEASLISTGHMTEGGESPLDHPLVGADFSAHHDHALTPPAGDIPDGHHYVPGVGYVNTANVKAIQDKLQPGNAFHHIPTSEPGVKDTPLGKVSTPPVNSLVSDGNGVSIPGKSVLVTKDGVHSVGDISKPVSHATDGPITPQKVRETDLAHGLHLASGAGGSSEIHPNVTSHSDGSHIENFSETMADSGSHISTSIPSIQPKPPSKAAQAAQGAKSALQRLGENYSKSPIGSAVGAAKKGLDVVAQTHTEVNDGFTPEAVKQQTFGSVVRRGAASKLGQIPMVGNMLSSAVTGMSPAQASAEDAAGKAPSPPPLEKLLKFIK